MGARLTLRYVPLGTFRLREGNPKGHDIARLKRSISEFGFVTPVVIEKDRTIVAGHGRVLALREMKFEGEKVPTGIREGKDWLVPCVLGATFAGKARADAYAIADNRLVELGGWDNEKLDGVLERIQKACGGNALQIVGWSPDKLIAETNEDGSAVRVSKTGAGRIILVYLSDDERKFWLRKLGIETVEKIETLRRAQWRKLRRHEKQPAKRKAHD